MIKKKTNKKKIPTSKSKKGTSKRRAESFERKFDKISSSSSSSNDPQTKLDFFKRKRNVKRNDSELNDKDPDNNQSFQPQNKIELNIDGVDSDDKA